MEEEKYVVTVECNGVETIMAVLGDLLHAVQNADVLRQDGYESVTVKRYMEEAGL